MNIIRNSKIQAAETLGTHFYRITIDQAKDALNNIISDWEFDNVGWDALNIDKNYPGSEIINGDLYVCSTDGQDIQVGDDMVDPEIALSFYTLDELENYIEDATEEICHRYITPYEIIDQINIDDVAWELMNDYTFMQIVDAAKELSIIE